MMRRLALLLLLIAGQQVFGQSDSTSSPAKHDWRVGNSPQRATLYSAVLPGAGQIYNRKYWKAPIVWLGMGISAAFIVDNNTEYTRYKTAYLAVIDDDPNTVDEFNGQYSSSSLLDVANRYRNWRDLSWICFGLVYVLNVMDASIDANFVRFDVGNDLSLRLGPSLPIAMRGGFGLSFSLTL